MPKAWGGVARRGGRVVKGQDWKPEPEGVERPGRGPSRKDEPRRPAPRAPEPRKRSAKVVEQAVRRIEQDRKRLPVTGVDEPEVKPTTRRAKLPAEVLKELERVGGRRAKVLTDRLGRATEAYKRDRYPEARAILRALARDVPGVVAVRELFGLVLYRMGSWQAAVKELTQAAEISDSPDQLPVLADCYRALGRHRKVAETWERLRQAGASAEVLSEGRLVMAGDLADQGKLDEAITLLREAAGRDLKRPRLDHLRQWYALGDLYERTGDIPEARRWFSQVGRHDPEHADVESRLRALR
jgi:tetratricopeptide (TPR) repeat protein